MDQNVLLAKNLKREHIDYLLESSNIYLCSSKSEGVSNLILEAMLFSLPIIATKVGDNDKLVIDDFNGMLVDSGDYKKMSNYLNDLVVNNTKREKFGVYSNKIVKEKFSKKSFKKSYLQLIDELYE